jgi:microcystin degradation protein MlrC
MRIAVGGILHESNTFAAGRTGLAEFAAHHHRGAEGIAHWRGTHHELAGFIHGGEREGLELYPTIMATATPGGVVTAEAFDTLAGELVQSLRQAPKLDGLLLALHGAMVSEEYPDADGEILRKVRQVVGPDFPLVVTHDFHVNLSRRMVDFATATVIYKTNPHVDQKQRGMQAAELMARIVRGEVKPVQALAKPPLVWNILHQYTRAEPLRSIMVDAAELELHEDVLVASVAAGYPYADVEEMGPAVVVTMNGHEERAQQEAGRLALRMWEARDKIRISLPGPAEAVEQALRAERGPVVLVEMGDNIGGGSPGDSTFILHELLRQDARDAVCVIYDPEAARACAAAGIGATVSLAVGGKTDDQHGSPAEVTGQVRSLHDGRFHEPEPRHGGQTDWNQGLTAVLELPTGTRLVVNSERTAPMSLHQLTSLGLEPERAKILVVKAAIAFRAAYEPIAHQIIEADTPGITAVNPLRFQYKNVRKPLWPLP